LLRYTAATGAAVHYDGRLHCVGETPTSAEIMDLIRWLDAAEGAVFATDQLSVEYAPALPYAEIASGLLAIAVSREPRHHVLWFRPEIVRTVKWAGEPTPLLKRDPPSVRLTPRKSFAEWSHERRGTSAPWSEVHIEAAESLRVVLLETTLKSFVARH
jgi:light-regulated signal transduction histidine kinase (bacteriophytochrome)